MDNVFQIDARIKELEAEKKILNQKRVQIQHKCKHVFDGVQWEAPMMFDDPPEGDYYQTCLKCKKIKFVKKVE